MSLNRNAYHVTPNKTKNSNKTVISSSIDKAKKRPPIKKKNPNKAK